MLSGKAAQLASSGQHAGADEPPSELLARILQVVNTLKKRPQGCSKDKALAYLAAHWMGGPRTDDLVEAERLGGRMRIHAGNYAKAVSTLEAKLKADLLKADRSQAQDANDTSLDFWKEHRLAIKQDHEASQKKLCMQV